MHRLARWALVFDLAVAGVARRRDVDWQAPSTLASPTTKKPVKFCRWLFAQDLLAKHLTILGSLLTPSHPPDCEALQT